MSVSHALRRLRAISGRRLTPPLSLRLVVGLARVVLVEPARRPVRLRSVTAARAVEGRDVLERDQDVPVQLHVRDVLEVAVGGQHPVLVLAAEEGDLNLLALVLVRVVLHGGKLADEVGLGCCPFPGRDGGSRGKDAGVVHSRLRTMPRTPPWAARRVPGTWR